MMEFSNNHLIKRVIKYNGTQISRFYFHTSQFYASQIKNCNQNIVVFFGGFGRKDVT